MKTNEAIHIEHISYGNTVFLIKGWKGARRNIWRSATHCSDCIIKATHADVRSCDSSHSVHYRWRRTSPLQNEKRLHWVRRGEIFFFWGGGNWIWKKKSKKRGGRRKHFYRGPTMSCNLYLLIPQVRQYAHQQTLGCNTQHLFTLLRSRSVGTWERERSAAGGRRLGFSSLHLTVVWRGSRGSGTKLWSAWPIPAVWSSNSSRKFKNRPVVFKQSTSHFTQTTAEKNNKTVHVRQLGFAPWIQPGSMKTLTGSKTLVRLVINLLCLRHKKKKRPPRK